MSDRARVVEEASWVGRAIVGGKENNFELRSSEAAGDSRAAVIPSRR